MKARISKFVEERDAALFTIEGTVLRRNKLDGANKHPWKAEVTEDDTTAKAETITNWYKEVYEPTYSTAVAE